MIPPCVHFSNHKLIITLCSGLQPGAALVVVCLAVVTLPPRSTAPTVAGCLVVVWLAVVSSADGLYAVALWRGCSGTSASAWGPFWPPMPLPRLLLPRSAWRGRGRVPIAGWSYGGVGPERVSGGEEEGGGVRSGPGEARTILLLHIISVRPSKQPLMVRTFLKVYMELGSYLLFLQEQIKDIIIRDLCEIPVIY